MLDVWIHRQKLHIAWPATYWSDDPAAELIDVPDVEGIDVQTAREVLLEAGLGFAVAWDKRGSFTGRDALLRQRETGLSRRLVLFEAHGVPLVLHEEPVLRAGRYVGRTTSGGYGLRTGKHLCFASIDVAPGETRDESLAGEYEILVAGERYALTPLRRAPYDPDGQRMRG